MLLMRLVSGIFSKYSLLPRTTLGEYVSLIGSNTYLRYSRNIRTNKTWEAENKKTHNTF